VTRNHCRGVQGLGGVEGREPLVDSVGATGFRQVLVYPVVDDVARDEQAHLGHMEHRRVVGICVADFDRNEGDPLEFEASLVDDVTSTSPTGSCPGNT